MPLVKEVWVPQDVDAVCIAALQRCTLAVRDEAVFDPVAEDCEEADF